MDDPQLAVKLALSVLVAAAIVTGLLVGVGELRWLRSRGRLGPRERKEMLLSLSPLPPNIVMGLVMAPLWAGIYVAASTQAVQELAITPLTAVIAFLAADFSYYWEHRCAHRLRPLWKLYHAIHHSSRDCTVATAYRVSFLTHLSAPAFYIPWILLGLDPLLMAGFQLFAFHYQAWLHTEMIGRLRWLDPWLNTPANHRMHHSRAAAHRDVNFGAVLMIWDRLFGSYVAPRSQVSFGIPGERPPARAWQLYWQPWRRLLGD